MPLQVGRMNWTDSHWSLLIAKRFWIDIVITSSSSPVIALSSHSAVARSSFSHISTFTTLHCPRYLSLTFIFL